MLRPHLFTRQFWRNYWIALRRSRRDPRDRKVFLLTTLGLLGFLVYFGAYFWFFLRSFFDTETRVEVLLGLFLLALAFAVRWLFLQQDQRIARVGSLASANPELSRQLAGNTLTLALLLARHGSEQYLRHKELPPNLQVNTRQMHLAAVHTLGLLDAAPPAVRNLFLLPDGHWPEDALNLWQASETLRCLRWVLRFDHDLTPLAHLPRVDYGLAQTIVESPNRLLRGRGYQDIWDIRLQRVDADRFLARAFAELVARGLTTDPDAETLSWARDVSREAHDPAHRDLFVSHHTVAELDDVGLRYFTSIAWTRQSVLQLLMNLIDDPGSPIALQRWMDQCFATPPPAHPASSAPAPEEDHPR